MTLEEVRGVDVSENFLATAGPTDMFWRVTQKFEVEHRHG